MDNVCIVIQGPTEYASGMVTTYCDYPHVIWSTWSTEPEEAKALIGDCDITLVESIPPANRGMGNINLQAASTRSGLDKAFEMGFEYVLRLRHDLFFQYAGPEDKYKWMEIFLQNDRLSFLCSYKSHYGSDYLVDYVGFGPIRKMLDFWSFYGTQTDDCAELQMKEWFKRIFPKDERVNFVLPSLVGGVDAFWQRRGGVMLSEYKEYPQVGYKQPWGN